MIHDDMTDEQERAEIERILRETQALEAQRRAENAAFQAELRAKAGLPAPAPKAKGGAREGAGRKPKWASPSTKVMRVPEAYAGAIRALIRHLDETHEVRRGYDPATSERLPIRSLSGRAQYVEFTVSGRDAPREIQDELNL